MDEAEVLAKHKARLQSVGFTEDSINKILTGEQTTYDVYVSQLIHSAYQDNLPRPDTAINQAEDIVTSAWEKIDKDTKEEFFGGVEVLSAQLELQNPDVVIFPLRGADPLRIGLDQLAITKNQVPPNYTTCTIPLGNTISLSEFDDGTGLWNILTESEKGEIGRELNQYNRKLLTLHNEGKLDQKYKLTVKELLKKKVFDCLYGYFSGS